MNQTNRGAAVALGVFDGVHAGHRAVIEAAARLAKKHGLRSCALTFSPHPAAVISGAAPPELMTQGMRDALFKALGIGEIIVLPFEQVRDMGAEEFVRDILKGECGAKAAACGFNFTFGRGGASGAFDLKELCAANGMELSVAPPVMYKGGAVSSTRVRECLKSGDIEDANAMLGRPFSYDFIVERGRQTGRLLGAPTANQAFPPSFALPRFGVYISKTRAEGNDYPSVTNVGIRPTVGGASTLSETHIMGFAGDLYGQKITVELLNFLRPEEKFEDIEILSRRIAIDILAANDHFNGIKAIAFDFDDTLQDRAVAYAAYADEFLEDFFPGLPPEAKAVRKEQMERLIRGGYRDRKEYFEELFELWGWSGHPAVEQLTEHFNDKLANHTSLFPDAVSVLRTLRSRGYKLGIITNGPSSLQNKKLEVAGIRHYFDAVLVSGDLGIHKPDRRIFLEAARRLGLLPQNVAFVGDHPVNDIKGALSAGMSAVRMNRGIFKGEPTPGVRVIDGLTELLSIF